MLVGTTQKLFRFMRAVYPVIATLLMLIISSCQNPCISVDCQHDGTCIEGVCYCADGYTGDECEREIRSLYYGTYVGDVFIDASVTETDWYITFGKPSDGIHNSLKYIGMRIYNDVDSLYGSYTAEVIGLDKLQLVPVTDTSGTKYTGSGVINTQSASITLIITNSNGGAKTYAFSNMLRQ